MQKESKVYAVRLPIDQGRELERFCRDLDIRTSTLFKRLISEWLTEQREARSESV